MICAVCTHEHEGPCTECHCAKAVEKHPHKAPYSERYDPSKEFPDGVQQPTVEEETTNPHEGRNQEL